MKKQVKPDINLKLVFTEKLEPKKDIAVLNEKEIEIYNNSIGYRKARMKRYGKSATSRLKNKKHIKT